MFTIETTKSFRVTVENYQGGCKRVTIQAFTPEEAMAKAQRGGWFPVDVKEV